jgi:hypothetical protein
MPFFACDFARFCLLFFRTLVLAQRDKRQDATIKIPKSIPVPLRIWGFTKIMYVTIMKVVNPATTSFWVIFVFTKLKYSFKTRCRQSEHRVDPAELHILCKFKFLE